MSGHHVHVVEDDPKTAMLVAAIVRSRGDLPRVSATVEEALRAMEEEAFCYMLLDQQLPADADPRSPALIGGGERLLIAGRKKDPRRTAAGHHVFQIVVLTGYSGRSQFVSKMYDLGCSAFLEKDEVIGNAEVLLDKIRECLGRAEREEHAGCGVGGVGKGDGKAQGDTASVTLGEGGVRLVIEGVREGSRSIVGINGVRREMQEAKFVVLVRLAAAHQRAVGAWVTREGLGIGHSRDAIAKVRAVFKDLVPGDFNAIEADRSRCFRLNPAIEVVVSWEGLLEYPSEVVKKLARERVGKGKV